MTTWQQLEEKFKSVSFGQPDQCQTCVRSVPGLKPQIETTAEVSAAHGGTAPPPAEP